MTDPGDKLARRYRELAREEPPASLDGSILAASRRAVAAKPSASLRWAVPVSIAAVLVLAFGVTLEMQREAPDVNAQTQQAPTVKRESPPASVAKEKLRRAPAAASELQLPVDKRDLREAPATRDQKDSAAPEAPARNGLAPREEAGSPQPAMDALEKSNAAAARPPAKPASPAALSAPAPESRAKARALDAAPAMREQFLRADPARELERIAKLREEGRNEEADKALEEFRRANPGFRIPEAMWERVRAR